MPKVTRFFSLYLRIYCGKCLLSCPTGAIKEVDDIKLFDAALNDNAKKVIVQIAPAVRVALGEEFGMKIGTNVEGQIYAALKQIGVYDIAETTFGADLTIMEEGAELLDRLQNGGKLPLFTSCSPGWIRFIETYNHEYLANLSSCKSPMQMTGAIIKTYYVNKLKLSNSEIVSVAIMPCIAKKDEAARPEMLRNGRPDVDVVLTTREFARYLKSQGIDLAKLKPERATGELAQYTGAGIIFGATGGVMEASLRTVAHVLGDNLERIDYKEARGQKAIKEATINIGGYELNIAVVHGGTAIKHFMNKLKTTKKQYHFVEFMGCIGGCINGGGQPILTASEQEKVNIVQARTKAIYQADAKNNFRRSYENKEVKYLYDSGFLTHKKAHELLHTTYKAKNIYNNEE